MEMSKMHRATCVHHFSKQTLLKGAWCHLENKGKTCIVVPFIQSMLHFVAAKLPYHKNYRKIYNQLTGLTRQLSHLYTPDWLWSSGVKHLCLFYEETPSHGPIPPNSQNGTMAKDSW